MKTNSATRLSIAMLAVAPCFAQEACDALVQEFEELNSQIRESFGAEQAE